MDPTREMLEIGSEIQALRDAYSLTWGERDDIARRVSDLVRRAYEAGKAETASAGKEK